MAEGKSASARSAAARDASGRNGAKSRGPRTAAGKATSAKNALKHGLRARQAVLPETLPAWVRVIEANLVNALGHIGQSRREHLDRLLPILALIDQADRLITAEFARLLAIVGQGEHTANPASAASPGEEIDVSTLRKLLAYRKRFRAQRDQCLKRIIRPVRVPD